MGVPRYNGAPKRSKTGKVYTAKVYMGLGSYPNVTLAEARDAAFELRSKRKKEGIDPVEYRAAKSAAALSFMQVADKYLCGAAGSKGMPSPYSSIGRLVRSTPTWCFKCSNRSGPMPRSRRHHAAAGTLRR